MNLSERVKLLGTDFKANQANRSKKRKTLQTHIQRVFGKTLSPKEVEDTIGALVTEKVLELSEKDEVTYKI